MKPQTYLRSQARKDLPNRTHSDNKTRGGKCLVIAGSKGMAGAALLTATAAARSGAGYVYLASESSALSNLEHPDFLEFSIKPSAKNLSQFTAVAIGPGLKSSKVILGWLKILARNEFANVVVDASALNILAKNKMKLPATWVLTPHEGELSRLLGVSSDKIRDNRIKAVQDAQKKWGCTILLKGHKSLIADSENLFCNTSGNPALAKAGTGDVLTGIIAAFLSQKLSPLKAAALAAFVHGLMADIWVKSNHDVLSLMATDLLSLLPSTLFDLRRR